MTTTQKVTAALVANGCIVWSETKMGSDGLVYSVRYLLDSEELSGLQAAGLIGSVDEVVGVSFIESACV